MVDSFSNQAIHETQMPEVEDLSFEALAPTYARTIIIESTLYLIGVTIVAFTVNFLSGNDPITLFTRPEVAGPYSLLLISFFVAAPLLARSKKISLREKDLHFQSGLIWRKTISLPFNRIQHIEIESGPIARLFHLTTLKFFTAGGGSADMRIPGLQFNRASRLRSFVLDKAGLSEETSDE